MKEIQEVKCLFCQKDDYDVLFQSTLTPKDFSPRIIREDLKNTLGNYKKHSRIVKCRNCGLVYTNPMENISALLKGYEEVVDKEYLETEKFRKILSKEHLNNIENFKKKEKILDIGCFAGYFLELAKDRGWEVYGIEPSSWAGNLAKKSGIKIVGTRIETAKLKENYYDAVSMWDVIEHLPDPGSVVEKSYKSLKKGGIIALGTPNIDSFVSKILRNNNPYLLRMHLVFFSPRTLSEMLERNGFKIVKIYPYGRTFPVSYVLDRVETKNKLFIKLKNIINSNSFISNYPIHLNIRDSFTIIAKK